MPENKYISKIVFSDQNLVFNNNMDTKTCQNCSNWYLNARTSDGCPWSNRSVPKAEDFCSRWELYKKDGE